MIEVMQKKGVKLRLSLSNSVTLPLPQQRSLPGLGLDVDDEATHTGKKKSVAR